MNKCLECKKPIETLEGKKKKVFCNNACRLTNWRKNKNKKKCLESDLINADLLLKIEDYITKRHPIVLLEKSGVVDFIPIADERYMKFLKMIIQLYDTPKETEVKVKDLNDTASKSNRTINTLNHEPKENSFHFFNKYGCFTNAERLELEK